MALILWPLLLSIPIPFVWAGSASSASLTPYITSVVPTCARSCLQSFIARNYPVEVCTAQNLNCLCINPSKTSYTLGEAATKCLYSNCKQKDIQAEKAYDICSGIPGAQPNRHTTLTVSIMDQSPADTSRRVTSSVTSSRSEATTSSSSKSSQSYASSTGFSTKSKSKSAPSKSVSSSSTEVSAASSATASDTILSNTTPSTTSSASVSSSVSPASQTAALTKPQIAGVVVASVGAAALSFGLCCCFLCHRRRKKHKRRQSDVSWGKAKVSQDSSPDMAMIATRDFDVPEQHPTPSKPPLKVVTPSQRGWQNWSRDPNPNSPGIGLALAPETYQPTKNNAPSPVTPQSLRTNSQLLPDRPHYSVFPHQPTKLPKRQSRTLHPPLPNYAPGRSPTMTGPRFPSSMDTNQANLLGRSQGANRSMSDPFYNDQHSPPMGGYRGVPHTPWTNPARKTAGGLYSPLSTYQATTNTGAAASKSNPQLTSKQIGSPILPLDQHYMAATDRSHSQKRPLRKKSASSSRYTRHSNDSGTSFEDVDDEPMPANSKSVLSPVTEIRSPSQPSKQESLPLIPIKSAKRTAHIINRPRPVPRRSEEVDPSELADDRRTPPLTPVEQTAKWKILVSPGLQSLEDPLPSPPQTTRTAPRTPTDGVYRPVHKQFQSLKFASSNV